MYRGSEATNTNVQSPATETSPLLGRSYASYATSEGGHAEEEETRCTWIGQKVDVVRELLGSSNMKMITKCTIAYFLGSLAT